MNSRLTVNQHRLRPASSSTSPLHFNFAKKDCLTFRDSSIFRKNYIFLSTVFLGAFAFEMLVTGQNSSCQPSLAANCLVLQSFRHYDRCNMEQHKQRGMKRRLSRLNVCNWLTGIYSDNGGTLNRDTCCLQSRREETRKTRKMSDCWSTSRRRSG